MRFFRPSIHARFSLFPRATISRFFEFFPGEPHDHQATTTNTRRPHTGEDGLPTPPTRAPTRFRQLPQQTDPRRPLNQRRHLHTNDTRALGHQHDDDDTYSPGFLNSYFSRKTSEEGEENPAGRLTILVIVGL